MDDRFETDEHEGACPAGEHEGPCACGGGGGRAARAGLLNEEAFEAGFEGEDEEEDEDEARRRRRPFRVFRAPARPAPRLAPRYAPRPAPRPIPRGPVARPPFVPPPRAPKPRPRPRPRWPLPMFPFPFPPLAPAGGGGGGGGGGAYSPPGADSAYAAPPAAATSDGGADAWSPDDGGADMASPDMGSPDMASPDMGSFDTTGSDGADAGYADAPDLSADGGADAGSDGSADEEWEAAPAACTVERTPAGLTIYAPIRIGAPGVKDETAIFVPTGFRPGPKVDLIAYFHGHTSIRDVKKYLANPWYQVREALAGTPKNAVLAVPMLGPRSEPGSLVRPGGLSAWVEKVLTALGDCGGAGRPRLGKLILAAHSGGGYLLSAVVTGTGDLAANLSEVWMFDAVYSHVPQWKSYFAGGGGVPARFAYTAHQKSRNEAIHKVAGPHVEVRPSTTRNHYILPIVEMPTFLSTSSLAAR